MKLGDLKEGQMARVRRTNSVGTGSYLFYRKRGGLFYNELTHSQHVYPRQEDGGYDVECELVQPRVITENTQYACVSRWEETIQTRYFVIIDCEGYRHQIEMREWKLKVPFAFRTIDKRCPWGTAVFTSSSGKFAKLLVTASTFMFRIDCDGNVTCEVDGQSVPSGQ